MKNLVQHLSLLTFKCIIIALIHPQYTVTGVLLSACPNVFNYVYDNEENTIGEIQVSAVNNYYIDVIRLDVELLSETYKKSSSNYLEIINPLDEVIEDLRQNKPLKYKLHFFKSTENSPIVSSILLNGNPICKYEPLNSTQLPLGTTITLQHKLIIPKSEEIEPTTEEFKPTEIILETNHYETTLPPIDIANNIFLSNLKPLSNKFKESLFPTNYWPQNNKLDHNENQQQYVPNYQNNPFLSGLFNNHTLDKNLLNISTTTEFTFSVSPIGNKLETTKSEPTASTLSSIEDSWKQPFSEDCGKSVNSNKLVINGNIIRTGAHPWLGAIFVQNQEGLRFLCGSTLISKKHVVTAAHCVRNNRRTFKPEEIWIVMGRENIKVWSNSDGSQIVQAESAHVHPDYKEKSADADIALIILSEVIVFSNKIRPACLWTGKIDVNLIFEKTGTVIGWGKDEFDSLFSSQPREVVLPVASEADCLWSNPIYADITSNRTFCAGSKNNSGPCNGDSGGGFLMKVNDRWTLRGIVSMSLLRKSDGNCDLSQYVVFTDAAQFLKWLLSFM